MTSTPQSALCYNQDLDFAPFSAAAKHLRRWVATYSSGHEKTGRPSIAAAGVSSDHYVSQVEGPGVQWQQGLGTHLLDRHRVLIET